MCDIDDVYRIKLYRTQIKIKCIQDMKLVKFTSPCLTDFFTASNNYLLSCISF